MAASSAKSRVQSIVQSDAENMLISLEKDNVRPMQVRCMFFSVCFPCEIRLTVSYLQRMVDLMVSDQ